MPRIGGHWSHLTHRGPLCLQVPGWLASRFPYNVRHLEWRSVTANREKQQDGPTADGTTAPTAARLAPGPPRQAATRFDPGELILNRFRIVRLIGRGGMGEVYEAEDLELGRIALKTIRPDFSVSPHAFDRFRSEIQLARKVGGPQVCRIHELFLIPAAGSHPATALLTMEYLEGITLGEHLRQFGPLVHRQALPLARDICDGLRLVHEQGIVHRDLKCGNIMLCPRGGITRAVLMDFGLAGLDATATLADPSDSTATLETPAAEALAGTPAYMAPEQFEGKPVSAATDIYALGVVLYEMLTGVRPYDAATPMGAAIRRAQPPPPVSSLQRRLPHRWDRIIHRCLEYDPARRYRSASDVEHALSAGPLNLENLRFDHPRMLQAAALLALVAALWAGARWWRSWHYDRPNAQAASWYQSGLNALREGSYLKATRCLDNAVQRDDGFVMAHARLAEAWADLDFDGLAQREMLIASAGENRVPPLDRLYLDAIRATLTHDYRTALARYREIDTRLPAAGRPAGLVDLGMAEEHAGDPQHALISYRQAQRLDPQNPAPFLRAAILETRRNDTDAANQDFSRAEALDRTEMNPEGQAELDYERGYLANEREQSDEANAYLNRAVDEAHQIGSPQLEIRALTQLSSVAYNTMHDADAEKLAQRAISLARDNQLNSWAADGFVRLASVQFVDGHYTDADNSLAEARQILQQTQQSRVEAMANLTLASLRDQQQRFHEVSAPAASALAWYKANGYFAEATRASLLLARADRSQGNTEQALREANEVLALATQAGTRGLLTQSEELAGSIYLDIENYPAALTHFQRALQDAGTGTYRSTEQLFCADVLTELGRFPDAEKLLASMPDASAGEIRVTAMLHQRRFAAAAALVDKLLAEHPENPTWTLPALEFDRAMAEAATGRPSQSLADLEKARIGSNAVNDEATAAYIALRTAQVEFAALRFAEALQAAEQAEAWFSTKQLPDSELQSSLIAAAAASRLGDAATHQHYLANAVDIQNDLRKTWEPSAIQSYLSRPDLQYWSGKPPTRPVRTSL